MRAIPFTLSTEYKFPLFNVTEHDNMFLEQGNVSVHYTSYSWAYLGTMNRCLIVIRNTEWYAGIFIAYNFFVLCHTFWMVFYHQFEHLGNMGKVLAILRAPTKSLGFLILILKEISWFSTFFNSLTNDSLTVCFHISFPLL